MTIAERNFVKKKEEIEQNTIFSLTMRSDKDFFSDFYYPDEIVTGNEGNVEVLYISRALSL